MQLAVGWSMLGCTSEAQFRRVSSEDGRFSVELPTAPTQRSIVAQSDYGSLDVTMVTAEFDKENYAVIYLDYPRPAITSPDDVFDHALLDAAADLGGRVERHFQAPLGDVPGRGYELEFGRDRVAFGRFYLLGARVFHVQVALPQQKRDSPHIERFLQSFRLRGG